MLAVLVVGQPRADSVLGLACHPKLVGHLGDLAQFAFAVGPECFSTCDRLILRIGNRLILLGDLRIDASNFLFSVGVAEQTFDLCPYLLKETAESIPTFLKQADKNGPAIGDEVRRLQPGNLKPSPGIRHESRNAKDGALKDSDEEALEIEPFRLEKVDASLPFHLER